MGCHVTAEWEVMHWGALGMLQELWDSGARRGMRWPQA